MAPIPRELRTDSPTEHENLLRDGMRPATGPANELGAYMKSFDNFSIIYLVFLVRWS